MATSYHALLRQIAHHCGALRGDATVSVETSYIGDIATSGLLTTAEIRDDTAYNFTAMIDALLSAEEEIVWAVASTGNHPWRSYTRGVTASLAHNATLPINSSTTIPIIGSWGTVYDATDSTPLVEMPLDVIVRRVRNANTHYVCPVYYYKFDGNLIRHTRTNVVIEVCVYNRTTSATAVAGNGVMLVLPDVAGPAIVNRALAILLAGTEKGQIYGELAAQAIAGIKVGITSVPAKSVPVAITNQRAN